MGRIRTTGNSRTRTRLADLPAAAAFNPVTAIPWVHLYYAGGPVFQALGLSDGASMSSTNWPDEIATNAADLNGGGGTYQAANAAMNGKPAVLVPASGAGKKHTTTVAGAAQVALPFSIICIFDITSATSTRYIHDGANEGNTGNRVLFRITGGGPTWSLFMGTDRTGGTPTTGVKPTRILATSGNDTVTVAGSTVISGANAGDVSWQGLSLSPATVEMAGRHAFWGIYSGDITADGQWSAFQTWVLGNYGVAIS